MKRIFIGIVLFVLLGSCAGGGKYPPHQQVQGDLSLKKFRDLFLQGMFCAAEDAFRTAIVKYSAIDSPCDISEAYLERYLLFSYIGRKEPFILEEAERFASLGDCAEEKERIETYKKGRDLPEGEDSLSKSVSLRRKAIRSGNMELLKRALEIDRTEGWTSLLWMDLKGLVKLSQGQQKQRYLERLRMLEKTLQRDCLEPVFNKN